MQKPLAPLLPVDFIMPGDDNAPTLFKIRALSGAEYHRCMCYAASIRRDPVNAAVSVEKAVEFGLTGWENFGDVKFSDNQAENIRRLNPEQFSAIGNEILQMSKLDEEDKKK